MSCTVDWYGRGSNLSVRLGLTVGPAVDAKGFSLTMFYVVCVGFPREHVGVDAVMG